MTVNWHVRSSFCFASRVPVFDNDQKKGAFQIMNEFLQSAERESSTSFAFLKRASIARWAPIPLRIIVGYGFMAHGFAKLSKGPEAFAAILHAIGVPAPHLMAWLTILTELIGRR